MAVDSARYGPWDQDVAMVPATLVAALHGLGWQLLLITPDSALAGEPEEVLRILDGLIVPEWSPRTDTHGGVSQSLGDAAQARGLPVLRLDQSLLVPNLTSADYTRAAEGLFSGREPANRA